MKLCVVPNLFVIQASRAYIMFAPSDLAMASWQRPFLLMGIQANAVYIVHADHVPLIRPPHEEDHVVPGPGVPGQQARSLLGLDYCIYMLPKDASSTPCCGGRCTPNQSRSSQLDTLSTLFTCQASIHGVLDPESSRPIAPPLIATSSHPSPYKPSSSCHVIVMHVTWYYEKIGAAAMGSMDYDTSKNKPRERSQRSRALVLALVLTNAASILVFSGAGAALHARVGGYLPAAVQSWGSGKLLRELNVTGLAMAASHAEVVDLYNRLGAANTHLEALLGGSTARRDMAAAKAEQKEAATYGLWERELDGDELRLAVGPHRLPLGRVKGAGGGAAGAGEMFPSLGQACHRHAGELARYMNYTAGGECPSDEAFAQRLMLKGCEPLPRRRCRPRTPKGYVEPAAPPASLWSIPPDSSIVWDAYTCKNYSCLVRRGRARGSYDCKDCFDLGGREKARWMGRDDAAGLDFSIDGVLAARPPGTVRLGLDIGGGSGTFAARMRERGVTVVTTSMNFDGPFNSFVASRGLVPMHLSVAHRLPFFDDTLDVVHSMHVLSSWIPDVMLEFTLFDVYRVLRPGGLFWLDHFFCHGTQLDLTYVPMFERIGFKKLRWNAGRKLDRGIEKDEWYISALLEKPRR
ncbi:hypothetical protein ACP4OV_018523 [Aristida adscensionis]